jgi:hypothetical protein
MTMVLGFLKSNFQIDNKKYKRYKSKTIKRYFTKED